MAVTLMIGRIDPTNFVWIAAASGVLLVGGLIAVVIVKCRFGSGRQHRPGQDDFSLEQLEQMLRQGRISDQEFEALKAKIVRGGRP